MEEERRPAAFFDVDGTLVRGTVIQYYAWLVSRSLPRPARAIRLAALAAQLPRYWWLDRCGRHHFLRAFYRNYAGFRLDQLTGLQEALFREVTRPRLHREGEEVVRAHSQADRPVVILSASLPFVLEPLFRYLGADALICQQLAVQDGLVTGELEGLPLDGEERVRRMRDYAECHGIDLSASSAYGDSAGDIPMLAAVGHPVAVNPSGTLRREAERRGWEIARW